MSLHIALLADHVVTIKDRTTIGVTDAVAYREKSRKVSSTVADYDLDIWLQSICHNSRI